MIEAVGTPETSVNLYKATRRNIPEDSYLGNVYHFSVRPFYSDLLSKRI
jgi:hypothetical protein